MIFIGLGNNPINIDGKLYTILFEYVFPFVGEFFGKITALFDLTYNSFFAWISNFGGGINVLNLFTGQIFNWECPEVIRVLLNIPVNLYGFFMNLFLPNYLEQPLWVCLIIGSLLTMFFAFLINRLIYFLKSLIGLGD